MYTVLVLVGYLKHKKGKAFQKQAFVPKKLQM